MWKSEYFTLNLWKLTENWITFHLKLEIKSGKWENEENCLTCVRVKLIYFDFRVGNCGLEIEWFNDHTLVFFNNVVTAKTVD
jgi:hypothetical protein